MLHFRTDPSSKLHQMQKHSFSGQGRPSVRIRRIQKRLPSQSHLFKRNSVIIVWYCTKFGFVWCFCCNMSLNFRVWCLEMFRAFFLPFSRYLQWAQIPAGSEMFRAAVELTTLFWMTKVQWLLSLSMGLPPKALLSMGMMCYPCASWIQEFQGGVPSTPGLIPEKDQKLPMAWLITIGQNALSYSDPW